VGDVILATMTTVVVLALVVSEKTVDHHMSATLRKLDVRAR
jgi:DNA-binding NarL/FixJ family response regulator